MEQRIGFGRRLGAYCLDVVIVCVLAWLGGGAAACWGWRVAPLWAPR